MPIFIVQSVLDRGYPVSPAMTDIGKRDMGLRLMPKEVEIVWKEG